MSVSAAGALLERRRIELLDAGLPCLPHHHEAQRLPREEAEGLVARVRASASHHAGLALEALAEALAAPVGAIALRTCPPLPPTVYERITNYRAQCVADTVMFREVLAEAAAARGWAVRWYDPRRVTAEAAEAMGRADLAPYLAEVGRAAGRPWQQDHRTAMAAAIAATRATGLDPRPGAR